MWLKGPDGLPINVTNWGQPELPIVSWCRLLWQAGVLGTALISCVDIHTMRLCVPWLYRDPREEALKVMRGRRTHLLLGCQQRAGISLW